jgi:hypothetical protein
MLTVTLGKPEITLEKFNQNQAVIKAYLGMVQGLLANQLASIMVMMLQQGKPTALTKISQREALQAKKRKII